MLVPARASIFRRSLLEHRLFRGGPMPPIRAISPVFVERLISRLPAANSAATVSPSKVIY
jgi:hypothetical protein